MEYVGHLKDQMLERICWILERSNVIRANAQNMIEYVEQLGNQMNAGRVLAVFLSMYSKEEVVKGKQ